MGLGRTAPVKREFLQGTLENALISAAEDGRTRALRALEAEGAWDRGSLADSIKINKSQLHELIVTLWTNAPHCEVIEFGAGPGHEPNPRDRWYPPIEPLKAWARKNLNLTDREAEKVAWAIRANIYKRGFHPRPYMRPAAEAMTKSFVRFVKKELAEMGEEAA